MISHKVDFPLGGAGQPEGVDSRPWCQAGSGFRCEAASTLQELLKVNVRRNSAFGKALLA